MGKLYAWNSLLEDEKDSDPSTYDEKGLRSTLIGYYPNSEYLKHYIEIINEISIEEVIRILNSRGEQEITEIGVHNLLFKDVLNESNLEFTDISSEKKRVYLKGNTVMLDIEQPVGLHVSESGGHRIIDNCGRCYYIKPVWDVLRWFPKEGQAHFVK